MKKITIKEKFSCFIFGEGGQDRVFLSGLIDLKKFKDHTPRWVFNYGNGCGESANNILNRCSQETSNHSYDLIICFIDLDDLKGDYPKTWEKEKENLEKKYINFKIIWHLDNAEDEYRRVLNCEAGKRKLNNLATKRIQEFINSPFWKKILQTIKDKENELNSTR